MLPFLFYHFERSARGMWVFIAFLVSCALLMVMSWLVLMYPGLTLKQGDVERGIFVKNYIDQSQEFALCAVVLAYPVVTLLRDGKIWQALLLIAIAASFVANMAFVIVSRTALVTMPVMLAVFALMHLKGRTSVMLFSAAIVLGALAWLASPQLQATTENSRGITGPTRISTSRHRSGCGWNFGRSRCGSLPRRRSSATAPDRRGDCSRRPPPARRPRPEPGDRKSA